MHGVGRTVFSGNRTEEFQVEILSAGECRPARVCHPRPAPGGPLAETGVMQGMSGSPVYTTFLSGKQRAPNCIRFACDHRQEGSSGAAGNSSPMLPMFQGPFAQTE